MAIVLSPYELFYIRELLAADNKDVEYKDLSASLSTKFDNAYKDYVSNITMDSDTGYQNLFIAFMKTNYHYETDHYRFDYSFPEELVEIYDKANGHYFKTRSQKDFEEELFEFFNDHQFGITELHFCLHCGKPIESGLKNKEAAEERHPHAYCCNDCFPLYMKDAWGSNKDWRAVDPTDGSEEKGYEINVAASSGTNLIEVWKPSGWVQADWSTKKLD